MSRTTIRLLVILSTLSIVGVIVTQIYWVRKALAMRERQFNQQVHVSLQEVAEELARLNAVMLHNNPVEQLTSNYFLVNTNSMVDPGILEHYLKSSFVKHNIITDFEVGIYDCATNKMFYGVALSTRNERRMPTQTAHWLKSNKYPYYFGVRFSGQNNAVINDLKGWIWSSLLVLIAVVFFGYALFVILRQKQLTEVQRDFINNMTHELQTPIATIRIAADVLNTPAIKDQPERLKKYSEIIKEEALRLQTQVETVLNMAKAEKNKLPLNIEWLDVHQIISLLVTKYENNLSVQLKATEPYIHADRMHLTNAITNLLDNAFKYTPENPVIQLKTFNENGSLVVSVKDNGIGIAPEHRSKVFKKFYRVPTGNVHNVKGFGIGLSYVHQIAKAHHWKLQLDSEEGKGSEFKISIPLKK
ncbi:sensor histidine kinase [Runella slithyformis]|uniref:histidine kinase n=1 Tax=Runella slithyformis (strain ATCC 29530 / DSM 19594 / LMG 11500 / NCIMB 11436 / LSU 4) TaxID=761193 RepID=A0A7U4E709_RUNSL|nr:HAMP domain-containing sensor histidine kinase [Runella slithyformis]AEI50178.1 integral membrane sensor signal transduction histidine kinase [Runella slithyformis DSM 19594]